MGHLHGLKFDFESQKYNVLNYDINYGIVLTCINCDFLGLNIFRFIYFRTADQIEFGPLTKT